jgi:hypothetical protein
MTDIRELGLAELAAVAGGTDFGLPPIGVCVVVAIANAITSVLTK